MEVHWYLVAQDGTHPWNPAGVRLTDYKYMRQHAGAIDLCGFAGALIATQAGKTDPWTLAAALATSTEHMKFIVAQYAGVISPLWLAQMAATVDEVSNGRLIINIITGSNNAEALGIFEDHTERYVLADEYWGVFKRLMEHETVTFDGKYVRIKDATLELDTVQKPYPELMFGGSSDEGLEFAAKHADTWLGITLPPEREGEKVKEVKAAAARHGRTLRCGLRLHCIVRETEKEAWNAAQWLYNHMDKEAISRRLGRMKASSSGSSSDMFDAIGFRDIDPDNLPKYPRDFEVSPGFWSGIALIRSGPGTTLVGDPDQIVGLIRAYEAVGIETMILGSYPHLEEAYRFADLVMPLLTENHRDRNTKVAWL